MSLFGASAVLGAAGIIGLVCLWWLIAAGTQAVRLPAPPTVVKAVISDFRNIPATAYTLYRQGGLDGALAYTTVNVVLGVGVGVVGGVAFGMTLGLSRLARTLGTFPLLVAGTMPIVVLLPFLVLWFGTSRLGQAGLVILYTVMTVTVVVQEAITRIGAHYEEYALSLGASRARVLCEVLLPGMAPPLVGGVRVAFAAGWGLECVAELLGANNGVGQIIELMANLLRTADLVGAVVCIGLIGVVIDWVLRRIGQWVTKWGE